MPDCALQPPTSLSRRCCCSRVRVCVSLLFWLLLLLLFLFLRLPPLVHNLACVSGRACVCACVRTCACLRIYHCIWVPVLSFLLPTISCAHAEAPLFSCAFFVSAQPHVLAPLRSSFFHLSPLSLPPPVPSVDPRGPPSFELKLCDKIARHLCFLPHLIPRVRPPPFIDFSVPLSPVSFVRLELCAS